MEICSGAKAVTIYPAISGKFPIYFTFGIFTALKANAVNIHVA